MNHVRFRIALLALALGLSTVAAQAQTVFVRDDFTGVNGTTLQAHNPNVGTAGSWFNIIGNNLQIQTNTLRTTANESDTVYGNNTVPNNVEYATGIDVTFTARHPDAACATNTFACTDNYVLLFGRGDVTAQNGYVARLSASGDVVLLRIIGGTIVLIGSGTVPLGTLTLNATHTLVLSIKNGAKVVSVDGVTYATSADNTIAGATGATRISGIGMNSSAANEVRGDTFFVGTFAVTEARMLSYSATRDDAGRVLVDWTTAQEKDNLGYRVWRETTGRAREQVGPLVAGAAFLVRGAALPAGNTYRQLDHLASRRRAAYWIEELDLHGHSEWFGPIEPERGTFDASLPASRTMADLSRIAIPGGGPEGGEPQPAPAAPDSTPLKIAASNDEDGGNIVKRQWDLAAGNAVKISVAAEGWYRVTATELFGAGLDRNANPHTLQLFADGKEVAIAVEGEADGRIDSTDAIRFYGTGLDTPSTSQHVYWLTWGRGIGARIGAASGNAGTPVTTNYYAVAERRDKLLFVAAIQNGSAESFFGPLVSTDPASPTLQTLTVRNIDRAVSTAQLDVSVQGASDTPTAPHRVAVTINGHSAGQLQFNGQQLGTFSTPIQSAWLTEGTNTVALTALNGQDDLGVVSSVKVTYAHAYRADNNQLVFTSAGAVRLTGFTTSDVRLLDVTTAAAPVELTPSIASGIVTAALERKVSRRIIALGGSQFAHPARIEANVPSSLHARGADLVIVAHRSFVPALERLAALHRTEGLSVLIAPVDDVYDEFSFGAKDPAAIRLFIAMLRLTSVRPRAVLLAGDASFDPRNYLGFGDFDFVPTCLLPTTMLKTSSDGWFTDLDGDGVPDVAIGRIPMRTAADATAAVSKIVAYVGAPAGMPWSQRALMVHDYDPAEPFGTCTSAARAALPAGVTAVDIDVANGVGAARSSLLSEWNTGAAFVDYFGHGSVEVWTTSGLLGSGDATSLANASRLPFVSSMSCLNGYFHDLYTYSLAEALLAAPNGGAIGMIASSTLTDPSEQVDANTALVRSLFGGATFGEAVLAGLRASPSQDFRRSFQLFGDPMLRLRR